MSFSVHKPEHNHTNEIQRDCCSSSSCCSTQKSNNSFSIKESFNYAFNILFKDIYLGLFIGLLLGGLFTAFLPKELLEPLFKYPFLTYLAVLIISLPLYVCATASLPIAAAFLLSGMSSGGVFVFLSAGPATNSVTMGVIASMFGKKSLLIYLGVISILSIFFGWIFDHFFMGLQIVDIHSHTEDSTLLDTISTIILFGLMFFFFITKTITQFKSGD